MEDFCALLFAAESWEAGYPNVEEIVPAHPISSPSANTAPDSDKNNRIQFVHG